MSLKPQALAFDDRWIVVRDVVLQVLIGNSVDKKVWTNCFSDIYALCTAFPLSHAPRLYKEIKIIFEVHVENVLTALKDAELENMLKRYCACWDLYYAACDDISNLFSYMNNQCMKQHYNNYSEQKSEDSFIEDFLVVSELGLYMWSKNLISVIGNKLTSLVLGEICRNRSGDSIENQEVILKTINSFMESDKYKGEEDRLRLYKTSLEEPYLQQVLAFYRQKSLDLVDRLTAQEYISKCLQLLDEEGWRAKRFMSISYDRIISSTRQRLVIDHLDFINANCRATIESQSEECLSNAYHLLNFSSTAISTLVNEYQGYVEEKCLGVFKNMQDDGQGATILCESLVDIHEQQTKLIKKIFLSYPGFITSLDKGFNNTINKLSRSSGPSQQSSGMKISPVPDLLVRHCDQLLKKATKGLNENDLDDKLGGAITIFKYLEDKDVFSKIYSKHLAKRLIYSLSQSMDAEESMIKKLKQVCGHEYTGKLQRMLTDVKLSEDLSAKFNDRVGSDPAAVLGLSFNILVMQANSWPLSVSPSTFTIPQELEKSLQKFEEFYRKSFNGRKLVWHHSISTCEVKFNHVSRTYVMHTSLHIMSILVVFNGADEASFADVAAASCIAEDDLIRHLQMLVEHGVLLCHDGSKTNKESHFSLNFEYQNKRPKFKLLSLFKETAQETEKTLNTVTEDRKMFIQAAIVRTMKARKRIFHKALVDEVVRQSLRHFVPSHSFIKKMIEQLIDKQYIERVEDSIDEYTYVA